MAFQQSYEPKWVNFLNSINFTGYTGGQNCKKLVKSNTSALGKDWYSSWETEEKVYQKMMSKNILQNTKTSMKNAVSGFRK